MNSLYLLLAVALIGGAVAFQPLVAPRIGNPSLLLKVQDDEWKGEVVSNTEDGRIRGCTIENVGDSIIEWVIQIDG